MITRNLTFPKDEIWTYDFKNMFTGKDKIYTTRAIRAKGNIAPSFIIAGDTDYLFKKEILINIKDRFVGEDPTGRCKFNNFTIARVLKGNDKGAYPYEYNKILEIDEHGTLKFKKMTRTVDWKIFFKVYNSFVWYESDEYVAHLKV